MRLIILTTFLVTKTNRRTDREQYTRSNAVTARLLTLVKRQKPKHATDRTQTSDKEWWRQQSHCWAPFTDETSNWLGLCDKYMYNVFYGLLSTSYSRKLTYFSTSPHALCDSILLSDTDMLPLPFPLLQQSSEKQECGCICMSQRGLEKEMVLIIIFKGISQTH